MKYIVVHSGARDLYKVAEALYKKGKLQYLVTDDILLRKEYKNLFPGSVVKVPCRAFVFRVLCQIFRNQTIFHTFKGYYLGKCAGRLSRKTGCPLFAYSEYAYYAFKETNVRPKILFQFHPHAVSNLRIFNEEIVRHPETAHNLKMESEYNINEKQLQRLADEVKIADVCVAASSFTKETMVENGAKAENVVVAPYGVNISSYPYVERKHEGRVKFAFVGSYTYRKGINYLLTAAKELEDEGYDFEIMMTGKMKFDPEELKKYGVKNLRAFTNLSHGELIDFLHEADVFLFPSLCEGFAFVIIEAMSTGLPVIATTRTAGRDIITDGEEGFVIAPSDVEAIKEKMKYFIENREECPKMGKKASEKAKTITWDNFERIVCEATEIAEGR